MSAAEPFGLVVRFTGRPEAAESLQAALLEVDALVRASDGCLLHHLVRDRDDPAVFWITELFRDREAHRAAVEQPRVQEIAARLGELLADPAVRHETIPLSPPGGP